MTQTRPIPWHHLCLVASFAVLAGGAGPRPSPPAASGDATDGGAHPDPGAPQRIRISAGLPPGGAAGVTPGVEPGARGALRPSGPIRIQSRAEAAALSSQGTGTAGDPYVISDLAILGDASPCAFGFFWSDTRADYHLALRDVRIEGWATSQVYVRTATSLTIEGADLGDEAAGAASGVRITGGDVTLSRVLFHALSGDGIQITGDRPVTLTARDCRFEERDTPWGAGASAFAQLNVSGNVNVMLARCDLDARTLAAGVRSSGSAHWTIEETRFATRIGIDTKNSADGLLVTACVFETERDAIRAHAIDGFEIAHSEFRDSGEGAPLMAFRESGPGRAHHCVLTKTRGRGDGNECVALIESRGIRLDHHWITASSGDAFVQQSPAGPAEIRDCVLEGVQGHTVAFRDAAPDANRGIESLWLEDGRPADESRLALGETAPLFYAAASPAGGGGS
ncbi:MAG: hypothetical protein R3B81_02340 [bacterium]